PPSTSPLFPYTTLFRSICFRQYAPVLLLHNTRRPSPDHLLHAAAFPLFHIRHPAIQGTKYIAVPLSLMDKEPLCSAVERYFYSDYPLRPVQTARYHPSAAGYSCPSGKSLPSQLYHSVA